MSILVSGLIVLVFLAAFIWKRHKNWLPVSGYAVFSKKHAERFGYQEWESCRGKTVQATEILNSKHSFSSYIETWPDARLIGPVHSRKFKLLSGISRSQGVAA